MFITGRSDSRRHPRSRDEGGARRALPRRRAASAFDSADDRACLPSFASAFVPALQQRRGSTVSPTKDRRSRVPELDHDRSRASNKPYDIRPSFERPSRRYSSRCTSASAEHRGRLRASAEGPSAWWPPADFWRVPRHRRQLKAARSFDLRCFNIPLVTSSCAGFLRALDKSRRIIKHGQAALDWRPPCPRSRSSRAKRTRRVRRHGLQTHSCHINLAFPTAEIA